MYTVRHITQRIKGIRNIQHITRAMKLVAAARLRRAQERLEAARPYARKMAEVTLDLARLTAWSYNPLLRPHAQLRRALIVVFTGDRGLCGGYHERVVRRALQFAEEIEKRQEVNLYVVGRQGARILRREGYPVAYTFTESARGVSFTMAKEFAHRLIEEYRSERCDSIYLVYAKFYSALVQRPRVFQLLPVDPELAKGATLRGLFLFEPSRKEIIDGILPRYVESEVFRAFLECEVGELGARMTAMGNATENAGEMIERLLLDYHRARQTQITREIAEIVGGAEVIR
ncbi:MAG: ATP synthase F1 subunit gamma [Firmicutes bacterium]|nr:ATP synthase F1 subunit gamma [Bacillota bacterium]